MKRQLTIAQLGVIYNETLPKPTKKEVASTIKKIEARLADPAINHHSNLAVRDGYEMARSILQVGQTNYDGIEELTTTQSRSIAALAVDYLNGGCRQSVLLGVPLKKIQ